MNAWPKIEIPPVDLEFPPLKLAATWGRPIDRKIFNSYVCGITPYDATHLGHAATYLTFDLIHRYQYLRKRSLNFIENITDVDDPLLERARRDGIDWQLLAKSQIDLFQTDMSSLRVVPPTVFLTVSETINLVIEGISALIKSDLVYEIKGDYYYKIQGHLSELPISLEEAMQIFAERGGDPDRVGKNHQLDPLLWRANIPGEPGWSSPFGFGRPGWHIECAVIALHGSGASKNLDEPVLDIQGGGSDLIFPHHFMTKVIAEDISKKIFAAEYIHTGMLGLDGEKMSKSRGNLVFVHKLLQSGVDPMAIRLALMSGKYSEERMWSSEILERSNKLLVDLRVSFSRIEVAETEPIIEEIVHSLADDLNTPKVLEALEFWSSKTLKGETGGNPGTFSRFIDSALGLAL